MTQNDEPLVDTHWSGFQPVVTTPTAYGAASRAYRRVLHRALRHYDEQLGPRVSAAAQRQTDDLRRLHEEAVGRLSGQVSRFSEEMAVLATELLALSDGDVAQQRREADRYARASLHARVDQVQQTCAAAMKVMADLQAHQQRLQALPEAVRTLADQLEGAERQRCTTSEDLSARIQTLNEGLRAVAADVRELAGRQDALEAALRAGAVPAVVPALRRAET